MSVEGRLRIELLCRDNRIGRVRILSSRPLQLPLLFEDKPVEEVLKTLPMLYSICATAQSGAAARACREALGLQVAPAAALAESMLILSETAREHLWRVLIDWPAYLDEAVDKTQLPALSSQLPALKAALFDSSAPAFSLLPRLRLEAESIQDQIDLLQGILEHSVFAMPAEDWHGMTEAAELERWLTRRETGAARYICRLNDEGLAGVAQTSVEPLPLMDAESLHQRLQQPEADDFIAAPHWQQQPRETSCLTRQLHHPLIASLVSGYGRGLLTRLAARLLELASIPRRLIHLLEQLQDAAQGDATESSAPGLGLGVVEAARGRLVHRVLLSDGLIKGYQILAPTEWNFHPRGLVAQGLSGLACEDQPALRQQAALFIGAVDPCVGYSLELA